ncbi:pyridoxal phosphate phosphatase PHOSPHO2-like [Paramacrobiotus metropolitanus]|uniref:pyridoxal phosphate phosphatase PHOSPHO2-like n=1 Tax=Paramacrobiotus metropolitanus TaxID=2943436 RepID=UPI00244655A9|nr:pyridoxal phosphate phosphatase PHOSPHO2-like [Paramacrobiotus metropolitanus]
MAQSKYLLVLDFDQTIVHSDTYTKVAEMVSPAALQCLKEVLEQQGWPVYMRNVFAVLKDQGVSVDEIKAMVQDLPLTDKMLELLVFLREHPNIFDVIILSDANTCFIEWVLSKHGRSDTVRKVFANPARLANLTVQLEDYHHQMVCPTCPVNMCKRIVLKTFLEENRKYTACVLVGDGVPDLCPALLLSKDDLLLARKGYPLELAAVTCNNLAAQVVLWTNGQEIVHVLQRLQLHQ